MYFNAYIRYKYLSSQSVVDREVELHEKLGRKVLDPSII